MEERDIREDQDPKKKPQDDTQELNESDLDNVTGSVRWPPQVEE